MVKEQLTDLVASALQSAVSAGDLPQIDDLPLPELEAPKSKEHGDYATNVALVLSKPLKMAPRKVAEIILSHLNGGTIIQGSEIAGPGFINFRLKHDWLNDILLRVLNETDRYGNSDSGAGKSVQIEFVSANPNGPITVAHGRGGAIGDSLANLLTATGYAVQREFYINDALNSTQMNNFGKSVHFRYMQLLGRNMGKDDADWLYKGDYVTEIARDVIRRVGTEYELSDINDAATVQTFRGLAQEGMLQQQKDDLRSFGIVFDRWFSEQTLHESGDVAEAMNFLEAKGYTYQKDGAVWLKSTMFGDDKDRVLVRADGSPTYIAGDVAYHKSKLERFDLAVDVWGADHGGYIARTKAAVAATGFDPDRVTILLFQLVRIMKDGELVRASKRRGNVLELKADLVDEIGKDAARFFFLSRSSDTSLDIDMDLAREHSSKNPVYYVQYAHARCCTVSEKAAEQGVDMSDFKPVDLSALVQPLEIDLIKRLGEWPEEVAYSAKTNSPHRVTHYIREVAGAFHTFYDSGNSEPALRVLCDEPGLRSARLVLTSAVRQVLKNALTILGVSAPVRM